MIHEEIELVQLTTPKRVDRATTKTHFLVFLGKTEWTGKITVIETNVFGILDSYNNLMSNLNEFRQQVDRSTK